MVLVEGKTKKKSKLFTFSLLFLAFTVVLTVGLYFYNKNIVEKKLGEARTKIEAIEKQISEIQENEDIKIHELMTANAKVIENLEYKSKITKFIKHMKKIEQDNGGLKFTGFSYSNGNISTSAGIVEGSKLNDDQYSNSIGRSKGKDPYVVVSDFIEKYREDRNALFDLKFINQFNGDGFSNMEFGINFTVKPISSSDEEAEVEISK